jgi:hypothetical protein
MLGLISKRNNLNKKYLYLIGSSAFPKKEKNDPLGSEVLALYGVLRANFQLDFHSF